ncbi:hypothetical protein O0A02_00445 [Staphylococcus pseudintermedius]|nr:hypothetical protein [Staphylococcus pseudintermedius]MDK3686840.1 hypothetical protein [Staphylococcus pseudintermedius]MDK3846653.1 hypothetical protein [Staphylococcus pseudintermedius]
MKFTVADLTSTKNDIRKYLISETDIYVDGDKLYNVVIDTDDYNYKAEYDELKRKLDDVVDLFNTHLYHKKAWSDNPYYDVVQRRLNQIVDGYPVRTTRLRRIYSTEIEQVLKHKNLAECLFLLEKIKMDLEEDE